MSRTLRTVALLLAVVVLVFALRPRPEVRELPVPEPVLVPDAAGRLVVDLVDGASEHDLAEIERMIGADLDWTHPLSVDEALAEGDVLDMDDAVALLAGHPLVEVAEPALEMEAFGYPNDPMYSKQWHLRAMGAPAGWEHTPKGRKVIVAVIDTGVTQVEDLEGTKVLDGASFVPTAKTARDDNGHGTHVAGTIAQTTNNGKGCAGVAPEATILPVKVLSSWGSGMSSWIAAGIDYAVDEGADVINLSLGGRYSLIIHNAVRKARAKGVIVVAAAGNSGRRGVSYPGGLRETIGVSATGPGGALAPYSSYGKGVDIAGPGGDKRKPDGGVWQDTIDKKGGHVYAEYQGTSMATPHVAGAAAILLSTGACDASCTERMLLRSAKGDGWDEKMGHGQLDLAAALGTVDGKHGGIRFFLGALIALVIAHLAGGGLGFRTWSALFGGAAAGGLFFLGAVPFLPDSLLIELLSTGVLSWPGVILGPSWTSFPLWCSALVPAVAGFTLGAFRPTRPLAIGLACGIGAHLFHGAATGSLEPWWMPVSFGMAWLAFHGTASMLIALGLAGAEKLDQEKPR
jgi:serine protease